MQAVLNVLWDKLLPALRASELAADPAANDRLRERLEGLSVKPAAGARSSPIAEHILNRRFEFAANDQKFSGVTLKPRDAGKSITLAVDWDGQVITIPAGFRKWEKGRAPYPGSSLTRLPDEPVAGTFAWAAEDTLVVKFFAYETPFHMTCTLRFAEDMVTLETESNVAFGPTKGAALRGRLKSP